MAYTIDYVKVNKGSIQIKINKKSYLCDEYIYQVLLPYVGKTLNDFQYRLLMAFINAYEVLKPNYKKIFNKDISRNDLKNLLMDNEISELDISLIIEQFLNDGYLDDKSFIQYHKELFEQEKGSKAFKSFLISHRIPSNLVEEAMLDYNESKDYVLSYIDKLKRTKHCSTKVLIYTIKQNLYAKGFNEKTITDCLKQTSFDSDLDNLAKDYQKILKTNQKNKYKIISKLVNKGYNVDDVKKIVGNGEDYE